MRQSGICRMVDNFMTEWEQRERRPPLVLVDSYGNNGTDTSTAGRQSAVS